MKIFKRVFFLLLLMTLSIYSQKSETNVYGGITLPLGGEFGVLNESALPKINFLKVFVRSSIIFAPVFSNDYDYTSLLIIGLQPGLRLKLIDNHLLLSGGISINPLAPIPFNGIDFGMGSFLGVSYNIGKVEIGLHGTTIFGREVFINKIGWLSFSISKNFNYNSKKK